MEYVRRQFGVGIRVIVVNAGTPVAYGRIREWGGRPEADLFWSGEPALYDDLAERKLLVPHESPEAMVRDIPATIGTPKPIALKDPKGFLGGFGARLVRHRVAPPAAQAAGDGDHDRLGRPAGLPAQGADSAVAPGSLEHQPLDLRGLAATTARACLKADGM